MFTKLRAPLLLAVGMLLGVGTMLGLSAWAARESPTLSWQQVNLFAEVYERVRRDYIEAIPEERLMDAAVRGMVAGLDQYSTFMDVKEYEEMRTSTAGEYSGVGIEISLDAGAVKVVVAIDGSPAARAGIRGGDTIVAVDDVPVDPANLDATVDRMRGKPGAQVKLSIARAAAPQPLHFLLVRRKVQVHSVKAELLAPGFGYVRIAQFSETTADDFAAELKRLQSEASDALRGLVLDLRNNPGGVLEAAVEVADQFLEQGVIVTADGRTADARFAMSATPGDVLHGAPIVVLVNGGSASASEIVAGALHDRKRALLMGQTTYGKGSVQSVIGLSSGGALKLTTSRYHTPSGASIQQHGIVPDVELKNVSQAPPASSTDSTLLTDDAELRMALERLKTQAKTHSGNAIGDGENARHRSAAARL